MQIVDIDGRKWAIEFEWEILPNEGAIKKEMRDVAKRNSLPFGTVVSFDDVNMLCLSDKIVKNPIASICLAVANQEAVANASDSDFYRDWIVVEKLEHNQYWMGVIKNGVPAPGFDKIESIDRVKERIFELLEVDTYKIYSTSSEIGEFLSGAKSVENKGLSYLAESVVDAVAKTHKLEKLTGIPTIYMYMGIGVVGLAVLAVAANTLLDNMSLEEGKQKIAQQAAAAAAAEQAELQKKQAEYQKSLEDAKNAALSKITSELTHNPQVVMSAWVDSVSNVELNPIYGWEFESIKCEPAADPNIQGTEYACMVFHKRVAEGSYQMFRQSYPDAVFDGDKATVITKFPNLVKEYSKSKDFESIKTSLPYEESFLMSTISNLQVLGLAKIRYELKASEMITYQPPAQPLSKKDIEAGKQAPMPPKINLGISKGQLVINGNGLVYLSEVLPQVDSKGLAIKNLELKAKEGGVDWDWTLTMTYFFKNPIQPNTAAPTVPGQPATPPQPVK